MKKFIYLALLATSVSFSQTTVKEAVNDAKEQIKQTTEVVKDGATTVKQGKQNALSIYGDLKEGTSTIYNDLKSLGIEGKDAMKDVINTLKQASAKTWELLVTQQKVWSWCYLAVTISSIIMFYRTSKQFAVLKTDLTPTGDTKQSNIFLFFLYLMVTGILMVFSSEHFEQMLTGFINPEFGALRTLIEMGNKIDLVTKIK